MRSSLPPDGGRPTVCDEMKKRLPSLRAVSLVLSAAFLNGCASAPKDAARDSQANAPFIRVAYPDEHTVELQIVSRRFTPARGKGPSVWLVGASHIGESNYYAALQKRLDAQTLVLYEGVGEHSRRTRLPRARAPAPFRREVSKAATNNAAEEYSLQDTMAKSLGLVFQLQAMDYDRTNFFNSDLTLAELRSLMQPGRPTAAKPNAGTAKPGRPRAPAPSDDDDSNTSLQQLLGAMDGSSTFGAIMKGMMQLIGSSPRLQALTKLAFIEVLGAIKFDPGNMKGLPPDMQELMHVLIVERNKVVVADLKAELQRARPGQSIAIFYGAGHLPDLELRLKKEFRLRPVEDVWLPAFSVNTAKAGLSNFEMTFLRSMVRSQLAPMNK